MLSILKWLGYIYETDEKLLKYQIDVFYVNIHYIYFDLKLKISGKLIMSIYY